MTNMVIFSSFFLLPMTFSSPIMTRNSHDSKVFSRFSSSKANFTWSPTKHHQLEIITDYPVWCWLCSWFGDKKTRISTPHCFFSTVFIIPVVLATFFNLFSHSSLHYAESMYVCIHTSCVLCPDAHLAWSPSLGVSRAVEAEYWKCTLTCRNGELNSDHW